MSPCVSPRPARNRPRSSPATGHPAASARPAACSMIGYPFAGSSHPKSPTARSVLWTARIPVTATTTTFAWFRRTAAQHGPARPGSARSAKGDRRIAILPGHRNSGGESRGHDAQRLIGMARLDGDGVAQGPLLPILQPPRRTHLLQPGRRAFKLERSVPRRIERR
eukprot:gene20277-27784_t